MPMIRAMRLLNAVEAGTTSGAQLQTLLQADPGRLAEFNVLLGMRGQTRRMAASSTAMAAVAASSTALRACWGSETALTALRAEPSALTALLASPFKSTVGNDKPSSLTATMLAGKTILLRSRTAGSSDTNALATKYQNGSAVADHVYQTSASYSTQMVAFQGIRHSASYHNYDWYGDVVKVD